MIFEDPVVVKTSISATAAAYNALATAMTCFLVMLATAYQSSRTRPDDFSFFSWLKANISRFTVGIVILLLFSGLTYMVPDVSKLLLMLGFNMDSNIPVSFGLALAAFLLGSTKKDTPPADTGKSG
jgi:hypothetical protein